jgi:hypothetical protein
LRKRKALPDQWQGLTGNLTRREGRSLSTTAPRYLVFYEIYGSATS